MKSLSLCAREIFQAGLAGGEAGNAVRAALLQRRARLELERASRIFVVGAGKAAGPMARGLEAALRPWMRKIERGLVLVPPGDRTLLHTVRKRAATHPIPSRAGTRGAGQILDILRSADADDLVIALISGGASAMAALPIPSVTLAELQALTRELLRSGASIADLNAVRKHLSSSTGGRMAEAAYPARVLVLVASDVEGNRLDVIGSGPFAPDPSTFRQAERVLRHTGVWSRAAPSVREWIGGGARGRRETPKPGARCFRRVRHVIVVDRSRVIASARVRARELGFHVRLLDSGNASFGPIERIAQVHERAVRAEQKKRKYAGRPLCLLSSGEAEVRVPPKCRGLGGRNQELALRLGQALLFLGGPPDDDDLAILCAGTDGIDGPTDAAGACVDAGVLARAARAGLAPGRFISRHDSYHFFEKVRGALLKTGRTGTNLLDLRILLLR